MIPFLGIVVISQPHIYGYPALQHNIIYRLLEGLFSEKSVKRLVGVILAHCIVSFTSFCHSSLLYRGLLNRLRG